MTRTAKKDLERHYLDRVKAMLPGFPGGTLLPHEEPDFLVDLGGRVLGIEITELHRDPDGQLLPLQAREARRDDVIDAAKALHDRAGHPPVDCQVHLKDVTMHRDRVQPLAAAIAEIVAANIPTDGELVRFVEPTWRTVAGFPAEVDYVRVARYDGLTESFFGGAGHTWLQPLALSDVQRALDAKEGNFDAYRRSCDEAWLVIAIDGHRMSTWFDDPDQVRAAVFKTRFARVLVLRNLNGTLLELKTAWP
ncbi:hypothetical protein LXT12_20540 [Pelomonas sp. P7]|uniref:Uncharacterized protein n=1 Tax=Pelomonas caseinilytica TaxID=2906763 RepID=A0ABS8XFH5_9BURK|nr:hypothetical protein [Pelomonas sp. P7]MCE4539644.1 hypothetical protein [Pelomonas sp. P7]